MIVTFYSNYLTHHQIPFCLELYRRKDVEFYFVSTMPMEEERKAGGWGLNQSYPFEIKAYASEQDKKRACDLALISDVVIIGSAPEEFVSLRMKHADKKLTLRYSERFYKTGRWRAISPRGMLSRYKTYFRYLNKPLYMLCASAYTAGDLALLGSYLGRCFKWGYFPKTYEYDVDKLLQSKEKNTIVWVARLIDWKHPEIPVLVAKSLIEKGYNFSLNMIGVGPLKEKIEKLISDNGLSSYLNLLGAMSHEEVRGYMEKCSIFLFTSDKNEGWGAVLNEAMNSACAVVANEQIGAVPFLLKNGQNGLTFKKNKVKKITALIEDLFVDDEKRQMLAKNAYKTITEEWCAKVSAERLIKTIENLLNGKKTYYKDGPLSKAKIKAKDKV